MRGSGSGGANVRGWGYQILVGYCVSAGLVPAVVHARADDAPPAPASAPEPQQPEPTPPEPTAAPEPGPAPAAVPSATEPDDGPKEVVVYLKDGQRLTGVLDSVNDEQLRIRVGASSNTSGDGGADGSGTANAIITTLEMRNVSRYEVLPPFTQRYLELRQAVGNDPEQILQLAEWLRARERYELALAEVNRALEIEPNLGPAREMKKLLEQQILLRLRAKQNSGGDGAERGTTKPDARGGAGDGAEGAKGAKRIRPPTLAPLTQEQINLIKVYEIDLASRPRLVIPRDTITRLMEQNAGHPLVPITREGRETWYRKDPIEVLDLMFRIQARDLYAQVQVLDQPESLISFRDNVHRGWLQNRCATDQCHGGTEAGRLRLLNTRPNTDATLYTNFLILTRFKLSSGEPLVDVDDPGRSALMQMGLPREDALHPHPAVLRSSRPGAKARDAWRPVFPSIDDGAFMESRDWISKLYKPRPTYPIPDPIPALSPPPKPAPAAAPARPAVEPAKPVK